MEEYTDVKSQVEYGLDKIDRTRTIEVKLKDFLYLHNVLGEFVRFFHQPLHFQTYEDVSRLVGDVESGALHLLWECYYRSFQYSDIFPKDIVDMIEDGEFENPIPPYYFPPK